MLNIFTFVVLKNKSNIRTGAFIQILVRQSLTHWLKFVKLCVIQTIL